MESEVRVMLLSKMRLRDVRMRMVVTMWRRSLNAIVWSHLVVEVRFDVSSCLTLWSLFVWLVWPLLIVSRLAMWPLFICLLMRPLFLFLLVRPLLSILIRVRPLFVMMSRWSMLVAMATWRPVVIRLLVRPL